MIEFIGRSDKQELDGIVKNAVEQIQEGEFNRAEFNTEILPFEYSLDAEAAEYVKEQVRLIIMDLNEGSETPWGETHSAF